MSDEDTTQEVNEETEVDDISQEEEGGLAEAIFLALNPDEDENLEEETEEEEQEEIQELKEQSEDEELENKDGTKPTVKTSEFIRSLKSEIATLKAEVEEARNRVDPDAEQIRKDNETLKSKIDSILFAESDDFKNRFVKPLDSLNQQLGTSIKTSMKEEDRDDIESSLRSANIALSAVDESSFFREVDTITELFGSASSRRISGLFDKIWDVTSQRREAESDLLSTKDRVLKENLTGQAKVFEQTEKSINDAFSAFEAQIAPSIELYRKPELKDKFKYDELAPLAKKAAVEGLKAYAETGAITPQLRKILMDGIVGDVHLNEKTAFIGTINNMQKAIEDKDKKISDLQNKLKKLGVSPNRGSNRVSGGSSKSDSEYGIADAVLSALDG